MLDPLRSLIPHPHDPLRSEDYVRTALRRVDTPLILVLDDAHLAAQAVVDTVIPMMIDRPPDNLRLVVSARPSISRALLRAHLHGDVNLIEANTLLFSQDEVEKVAVSLNRPVDADTASAIHRSSNGWPVAVRATLMSHTPGTTLDAASTAATGVLADYVVEEVFKGLDPDVVEFILAATTCSRLDAAIAEALSGRPDAAALLEDAVHRGLFLDRFVKPDSNPVYQWHMVFAEQCRSILRRRDPEYSDHLNQVAADQLADRYPMQAVVHALGGQAPAHAARIIEDHWLSLVVQSNARLLAQACQSLPQPWADDPGLLLIRACCLDLNADRVGGSLLYDRALTLIDSSPPEQRDRLEMIRALTTLIVADDRDVLTAACDEVDERLRGDHDLSPAMAASALFVLGWTMVRTRYRPVRTAHLLRRAVEDCKATGQISVAERANANLAFSLAFNGSFVEAKHTISNLPEPNRRTAPWLNIDGAVNFCGAGLIAYWQDDLPTAWDMLREAVRFGGDIASYATYSQTMLAWVAAATGDMRKLAQAQVALTHVPNENLRGAPWGDYRTIGHALIAEAYGHRDVALTLAQRIEDVQPIPLNASACADLLRRCGDEQRALTIVKELSACEQPSYVTASLLMTESLIRFDEGAVEQAHTLLEHSLDIASTQEIRRPFLNAGQVMSDALERHSAWGTHHDAFVADLFARSERGRAPAELTTLSRREHDVMSHLRTTMTNAEIAEALHVSLNTLKTHQRAIYRKLGVGNRRDAVRAYTDESAATLTPPG